MLQTVLDRSLAKLPVRRAGLEPCIGMYLAIPPPPHDVAVLPASRDFSKVQTCLGSSSAFDLRVAVSAHNGRPSGKSAHGACLESLPVLMIVQELIC